MMKLQYKMKYKYISSNIQRKMNQLSAYRPYIVKENERKDYILGTLTTEYIKQTFTNSTRSVLMCSITVSNKHLLTP